MPGPGIAQDPERVLFERLDVPQPVLYAWDVQEIARDSGQQVRARIREHRGEKKLQLKAPWECNDAVLYAAQQQALDFIQFNSSFNNKHVYTTGTVMLYQKKA